MTAARSVLRDVRRVTLSAVAAGALAAAVVGVFAAGARLRNWFGLTPEDPVGVPVAQLWLDNARALVLVFGAAAAVAWWPRARIGLDVVVCLVLGGNVLLVAIALAAYGEPLVRLAPGHYVLELLAVATAGAVYLDARREKVLRSRVVVACSVAVATLLLAAALLENSAASHRTGTILPAHESRYPQITSASATARGRTRPGRSPQAWTSTPWRAGWGRACR
jgi:hypothetical protein